MLLKLHVKFAPGWALIRVNFDPIQEIGPKVESGRSFVSVPFFARLRYILLSVVCILNITQVCSVQSVSNISALRTA